MILAVPGEAISAVGTVAVNCVLERKLVVRAVPFQLIVDVLTKLAPLTVRVKPGSPAVAELGERLLSVGTGLLMVKF